VTFGNFNGNRWSLLAGADHLQGGVKVYRGSAAAARRYVEADRGRADDYYLAEGTGIAERYKLLCLTKNQSDDCSIATVHPTEPNQG
jgi:hypothetical protein